MLYAARSHIGLVRQVNQDCYSVHTELTPWQLLVVADGMGGASAGEVASRMAADAVSQFVRAEIERLSDSPADLLLHAVHEANRKIWDAAKSVDEYVGMGTTLVAALYNHEQVIFVHVGDSRGYICRGQELRQVTRDHSLVAELVRRGQLTEEEAQRHPQRNIVTRSLGTAEHSEPDVDIIQWSPGDTLLLCTDGLSNLVTQQELASLLEPLGQATSDEEVEAVADQLIRLALERGGPDNITLVLVVHRERGDER
ncbi:Stp1/IreP family PP2C-type Ser/Thr phosphatase [Alicyclobacillus pomorum]|jgi:serine/threonine protein phosphatase PrpC|uniref:Stp1/IreP family PP2C-type Ser/Thr phosphatase n=1 Tax=Alicyclobacillus pomorum TaxID=204470 RepID=UPI00042A4A01|nr:Stp1/IreP family PP2C-type Ser/Thr phosphatase [Alicyclobacillus pomorum]